MNDTIQNLLKTIAGMSGKVSGAFNIRSNGVGVERHSTESVAITPKTDKPGIDIVVKPFVKAERVHIPVVITETGVNDLVYNDFEIGEGAEVEIVAGCGIHNDGCETSRHDGIHTFHLCRGARLKYVEKHYGEGSGQGGRVLNPTTIVRMDPGSYCEMEMVQIEGVDSTIRETSATLEKGAKLVMVEKLMTHGSQTAHSNVEVQLNGEDAVLQIVSRSVAKEESVQVFHPRAIGNSRCRAHVQCDSIIMDSAKISSIPEIAANHQDAQVVHEAAIGRINNDQLTKLQTLGLTEEEAEQIIVQAFLS